MKKIVLIYFILGLTNLASSQIYNLEVNNNPTSNYFTRSGNILNCYSRILFQGNVIQTKCDTFNVGYFLSSDNFLDANDILIGTYKVYPFVYTVSSYTDCPITGINLDQIGLSPGVYNIGVIADYDNQMSESEETDNKYLFDHSSGPVPITYSGPVGIESSNSKAADYSLNYIQGAFLIQSFNNSEISVKISDLGGKILLQESGIKMQWEPTCSGFYLVEVVSGNKITRKKFAVIYEK